MEGNTKHPTRSYQRLAAKYPVFSGRRGSSKVGKRRTATDISDFLLNHMRPRLNGTIDWHVAETLSQLEIALRERRKWQPEPLALQHMLVRFIDDHKKACSKCACHSIMMHLLVCVQICSRKMSNEEFPILHEDKKAVAKVGLIHLLIDTALAASNEDTCLHLLACLTTSTQSFSSLRQASRHDRKIAIESFNKQALLELKSPGSSRPTIPVHPASFAAWVLETSTDFCCDSLELPMLKRYKVEPSPSITPLDSTLQDSREKATHGSLESHRPAIKHQYEFRKRAALYSDRIKLLDLRERFRVMATSERSVSQDLTSDTLTDAVDLLLLMRNLGGKTSSRLFHKLRSPKMFWRPDGEFGLLPFDPMDVVATTERFSAASQLLQKLDMASIEVSSVMYLGTPLQKYFLDDKLPMLDPQSDIRWQLLAVRAMLHAFPEHRSMEPTNFHAVGNELLPPLRHALRHLQDDAVYAYLLPQDIARAIAVCVSGSYFGDLQWKEECLDLANHLSGSKLQPALEHRRLSLDRIYDREESTELMVRTHLALPRFKIVDELTNSHVGELRLLQARLLNDMGMYAKALYFLRLWKQYHSDRISTRETAILNENLSLQGEVKRYQGHFDDAKNTFESILKTRYTPSRTTAHIAAILCEQRRFENAKKLLMGEIQGYQNNSSTIVMRRPHLALAEAYVFEAVGKAHSSLDARDDKLKGQIFEATAKAKHIFESLRTPARNDGRRGVQIFAFRVQIGTAISQYMSGDLDLSLRSWEDAWTASKVYWKPGFTDAVIMHSISMIHFLQGHWEEAERMRYDADVLLSSSAVSYHFTGLGTIWMQYVRLRVDVARMESARRKE